jgi:hypothetical protein
MKARTVRALLQKTVAAGELSAGSRRLFGCYSSGLSAGDLPKEDSGYSGYSGYSLSKEQSV